jgi:hypothetical protein
MQAETLSRRVKPVKFGLPMESAGSYWRLYP